MICFWVPLLVVVWVWFGRSVITWRRSLRPGTSADQQADAHAHISGRSVQAALSFYKIDLSQIVVFHDELDLEPGKFRIKIGGGIAGHNGLRSIRQHCGENFARARFQQISGSIQDCSPEEFERFVRLNEAYKAKFGFIFVMAVRGSNRHQILAWFEERIHNSPEQELQRALSEINKIALFRLQAM